MAYRQWRERAGLGLAGILGLVFIVLGVAIAVRHGVAPADSDRLIWQRLFGVRDAFLGGWTLLLLATRQTRALACFLAAALVLPLVDTLVLVDLIGWRAAMIANLPYEVPLLLATWLLRPALRRPGG